ncbi:MAG: ankyrin repeat domain-containing protein, partial [Calditrichaeota bacterium]|nr:ankyrin repeat domain-containing protein [Calditrichota bacterium]
MQRILFLFYLSISLILAQNKDEIYETLSSQIKSAKLDAIKKTLEKGIDFTYAPEGKSSLLTVAVYAKQYEIVKLFIANGADLNSMEGGFQGTAIMYAAYNNDIKMVDLLLSLGADINQRDGSYG